MMWLCMYMYICVCVWVCVCEQTRMNGVDKVKSMLRKVFDGTIVPIKMRGVRSQQK